MVINDYIVQALRENVCRIKFVKSDGSMREMQATINSNFIDKDHIPSGKGSPYTKTTMRVYDTEKRAWRSFRFDSLKMIEVIEGSSTYNDVSQFLNEANNVSNVFYLKRA